jgi:hypothetical protein
MSLSRACLAIGKDASIITFHNIVDNVDPESFKDFLLGCGMVKDVVETKESFLV